MPLAAEWNLFTLKSVKIYLRATQWQNQLSNSAVNSLSVKRNILLNMKNFNEIHTNWEKNAVLVEMKYSR